MEKFDETKIKIYNFAIEDSQKLKEERSIVHYITTSDKDWSGDIIVQDNLKKDKFEKYRTVFFNHDYYRPIAKNLWLKRDEKGWLAKTQFAKNNLFADDIYNLYLEDIIKTWSVGIVVHQTKYDEAVDILYLTETELYEYSSAPLAANFNALDRMKSLTKSVEAQKYIEEARIYDGVRLSIEGIKKELELIKSINDSLKEENELNTNTILQLTNEIELLKTNTSQTVVEITGKKDSKKIFDEVFAGVISEITGRKLN